MNIALLTQWPLFQGIPDEEAEHLLTDLGARVKRYRKGETVYHAGDTVTALGLVLSGSVLVARDDFWGNTTVLDHVGPGQVFAETYACTPGEALMVYVAAAEPVQVLFLNMSRVLDVRGSVGTSQGTLVRNLLALSAQKNLTLSRKIFHTSPKTIRGRLLSYLSEQAVRAGSNRFTIPFDRQQLADYLSVERSALSHELGKMRREGLLQVRKNAFILEPDCQNSRR